MKKLELKHFAPYLQYKPSVLIDGLYTREVIGFVGLYEGLVQIERKGQDFGDYIDVRRCKLVLRPLSDLTNEIEVNGEKFVPIRNLKTGGTNIEKTYTIEDWNGVSYVCCDNESHELRFSAQSGFDRRYNGESRQIYAYDLFQKLLEWHFDIFGLIEASLAVDYNSLTK